MSLPASKGALVQEDDPLVGRAAALALPEALTLATACSELALPLYDAYMFDQYAVAVGNPLRAIVDRMWVSVTVGGVDLWEDADLSHALAPESGPPSAPAVREARVAAMTTHHAVRAHLVESPHEAILALDELLALANPVTEQRLSHVVSSLEEGLDAERILNLLRG